MGGLDLLPDELQQLALIQHQWTCRDTQFQQLSALLHPHRPSPSTIVLYGPPATGKSGVLARFLEQQFPSTHAVLRCKEFVSGRHLLERTVGAVYDAVLAKNGADGAGGGRPGRCENLSVLTVHLQRMLGKRKDMDNFVVVFDGVDDQRDAPPTLIPALARLGEFVPRLTTVLVMRYPSALHQTGVPHIRFPAYSREQSIYILAQSPLDIFPEASLAEREEDYDDEVHQEDKAWLWPRFCAAVWDSLAQSAARDLVAFRDTCHKLWRPFLQPVIQGDFGTRDFSRLVVAQRRLFQDESVLLDSIVAPTSSENHRSTTTKSYDLPYYARWLVVAAYLASFNPARMDAVYFMKTADRKQRRKRGGGAVGRPSQARKIPRHILSASSFSVDRLLAILHAILPHDLRTTIDVYTQIATLASLRLLVRSTGLGSSDPLEPGGKWRVGAPVTLEYAQMLARSLDFDMNSYIAE